MNDSKHRMLMTLNVEMVAKGQYRWILNEWQENHFYNDGY
jgi:hypothetical protein